MEMIGSVIDIINEMEFDWVVQNFFNLSPSKSYSSPQFRFAGECWYLSMYPNGHQMNNSVGYLDLFLTRTSSGPPICVKYTLGLKTSSGKKIHEVNYTYVFGTQTTGYGAPKYILRSELADQKSELVPSGHLIVFCVLKHPVSKEDERSEKLSRDLKNMMLNSDYSDITIKVKGEEFRLHKNILGARSLFFSAMFKSNMKENITGIVSIDDCEPKVFYSFVEFLYTGSSNELCIENACGLYEVANKYQEDQLKEDCLKFMINNIRVQNFCDFVVLALMHDETQLLEKATKFFAYNTKEIISTDRWLSFLKEYPVCANDMHIKALDIRTGSSK